MFRNAFQGKVRLVLSLVDGMAMNDWLGSEYECPEHQRPSDIRSAKQAGIGRRFI